MEKSTTIATKGEWPQARPNKGAALGQFDVPHQWCWKSTVRGTVEIEARLRWEWTTDWFRTNLEVKGCDVYTLLVNGSRWEEKKEEGRVKCLKLVESG